MARPKKTLPGPHIAWRTTAGEWKREHEPGARAYSDLRAYPTEDGGGREALAEPGSKWGTTDPEIALVLFEARLEECRAKRRSQSGVTASRTTALAELVKHHLMMKATAGISDSHLCDLEARLRVALEHFGSGRDPRTIEPSEVRAWGEELSDNGRRKPGTVRHYLNALSGLYRRAQEGLHVPPGYNPVAALIEKPSGYGRAESKFFEVADGALLLEAARVMEARTRKNATPGLHAIIATLLLTGGRWSEVIGLDVDDISFDRGLVRYRPNAHRGLKTNTSVRDVPLWPQLREILQVWMFGGDSPRTSGLLFPSPIGGMVGHIRKSLETMATLCGMESTEVRTRAFRHTYCSARLQTVQTILKPGKKPTDEDAFTYVEVSRDTVAREMGHGGTQLVARTYGHAQRSPYRAEVVEYSVERHKEELAGRLGALAAG